MGEQLARKIKAVKYLECSSSDGTDIEKVFEKAVWASLRPFEEERKTLIQKEKGISYVYLKHCFNTLHLFVHIILIKQIFLVYQVDAVF